MGGPGSGNYSHWWRAAKKRTVEQCRALDANHWMWEGLLKPGCWHTGRASWRRAGDRTEGTATLGYEVNTRTAQPWLRLYYTLTAAGGEDRLDYRIQLTCTRPRFGGLRWWFVCPLIVGGRPCNRRVGKLYLPPRGRYFGCRQCHGLTYRSCQKSHRNDALQRLMARELGEDLDTVKGVMQLMGMRQPALATVDGFNRTRRENNLSALRTLALVRKLAVPVLQVNIARKQVNVAGPTVPS